LCTVASAIATTPLYDKIIKPQNITMTNIFNRYKATTIMEITMSVVSAVAEQYVHDNVLRVESKRNQRCK
jgi:hypothetical protein